jgi:hypothetical protein
MFVETLGFLVVTLICALEVVRNRLNYAGLDAELMDAFVLKAEEVVQVFVQPHRQRIAVLQQDLFVQQKLAMKTVVLCAIMDQVLQVVALKHTAETLIATVDLTV